MKIGAATAAFSELRKRDPDLPSLVLLSRIALWKLHSMLRSKPVVRLHGSSRLKLHAAPGEHGIQAAIYLFRDAYEPSVRSAIDHFVQPGAKVYDIGANLGLWTLRLLERVGPEGNVCAFEPMPDTAAMLRHNIKLSGHNNAIVREQALSDAAGELILHVPDDIGRSSLAAESESDRKVVVKTLLLDEVWREQGQPAISFVKIDVEGAEPLVFRGAMKFLAARRPTICCEVNVAKLSNMGFTPADVTAPLLALGYEAWTWSDEQRQLVKEPNVSNITETCDLVFLNPTP